MNNEKHKSNNKGAFGGPMDHMMPTEKPKDFKGTVKKLLNYFGEKDIYNLFALKRADNLGQNPDCFSKMPSMDEALKIINDIINEQECFSPKNLKIDGKDLIEIGITDGKEIGYILGELLNLVVDESIVNEKDSLIEKAKELSKRKR
jgi:tRNA nucleotidyltransferase (CCA-adding enzyme)